MTEPLAPDNRLGRVAAVVVTYHPDRTKLEALLTSVRPQVAVLLVVDNASSATCQDWLLPLCQNADAELLPQTHNLGVATAHNLGARRAAELGVDYLLLLDHDSLPAADMVANLLQAIAELTQSGKQVAAVGPCYVDPRQNNPPPFIEIKGGRLRRHSRQTGINYVSVDYLIASGSLIPMTAWHAVGSMCEELFIDYIDVEWGLRAQTRGYRCFGVFTATMQHDLGEEPLILFGKRLPLHSPLRHYYLFRNALYLYRQPHLPWSWKWVDATRLLLRFIVYASFARPRRAHIAMMLRGLWHGLCGRMGAWSAK